MFKSCKSWLILFVLLSSSMFIVSGEKIVIKDIENETKSVINSSPITNSVFSKSSLISSEPIDINSDDVFISLGFPGSGTVEDPYIIEDYNITTTSNIGIAISCTTKYFVISNCYIDTEYYGIYINNVTDGTAIVINNTCNNNDYYGIYLDDSDSSTVANNTCTNNQVSIYQCYSSGATITNNTCTNNNLGIYLYYSSGATITNNTCTNNNCGIYLIASDSCLIIYNNIRENSGYGIETASDFVSYNNIIHHNYFVNNSIDGFKTSQAYDYGVNTTWYDTISLEGNYWSDWYGSGSYSIDGLNYVDPYPMFMDSDSDGLPDYWEQQYGFDILVNNANEDPDQDGLTNLEEYLLGTNPSNYDTDNDGYSDGEEIVEGTDPLDPSSYPSTDLTGPNIYYSNAYYDYSLGKSKYIAMASDLSGVIRVTVYYAMQDSDIWTSAEMEYIGNETYIYTTTDFTGASVKYYFEAEDTFGNVANTSISYFVAEPDDLNPPVISNITVYPHDPTELDNISISAVITDESGLAQIELWYRINEGSWIIKNMLSSGDTYWYSIGSFNVHDDIDFYIWCNDEYMNAVQSTTQYITIMQSASPEDTTPPVINFIDYLDYPVEGESIPVNGSVTDNTVINTVIINYRVDEGQWMSIEANVNGDLFEAFIGPFEAGETVQFYIWASDTSGNNVSSDIYTIIIQSIGDNIAPTISVPAIGAVEGQDVTIEVTVFDSSGVDTVLFYYQVNSGTWFHITTTLTVYDTYRGNLGSFLEGDYINFYVWANDTCGNEGFSETISFTILENTTIENQPPTVPVIIDSDTIRFTSFNLQWYQSTDPDGAVKRYEIELSYEDPLFQNPIEYTETETSLYISSLQQGTYYIRIRAVDYQELASEWSETAILTVDLDETTTETTTHSETTETTSMIETETNNNDKENTLVIPFAPWFAILGLVSVASMFTIILKKREN